MICVVLNFVVSNCDIQFCVVFEISREYVSGTILCLVEVPVFHLSKITNCVGEIIREFQLLTRFNSSLVMRNVSNSGQFPITYVLSVLIRLP